MIKFDATIADMDTKDLLTTKQVAERHSMTVAGVHYAIKNGDLKAQNAFGRTLITREDCENWKPRGRGGARPGAGQKKRNNGTDENTEK